MNHNDSQKLGSHQSPDSGGALESHRSSLLPVAEEEETLLESSVDAVDMATGTQTESSDVTTATGDGNGRSADSANQVVPKGGSDITASDAGAGQSPTGGDRGAHKKELEKEQSMESQEGQKAQEDSETSAADKEVSTSALSEDTSEQEDRRNSFSLSASEKEVETEFHRLSLSFKCDMYTLEKRLRLEERSRDLAEENVRKEVASCQGLLQALSPLCEDDSQSVEIIQRLQKNLDILIQSMVRVSSRSETLGAIHQESRVGKAVEVMIQHVENLRRTYTKEHAELVELRESVSNSERSFGTHSDRDDMSRLKKQSGSQYYKPSSSRRVSIAVMSKSPDSGDGENGRRQPWKGGGGGQRPPLKRFVSSGGWPDGEGPRNNMEDSSSPSYPNRFAYDTDSHSEEERREEQPVVVERRKSSLTELGNKLTSLILPLKMQSQSSSPTKDQSPPPSAHNTPEPHRTSISSTSSSTHPSSTSTSSSTSSWSSYLPSWRPGLGLGGGLGLQGVGVPGRGVWMWALALVVLACLLAVLASLVLQPAADAAPVGTGDSWMTIQQLLWPYTSLRHNGQPPV